MPPIAIKFRSAGNVVPRALFSLIIVARLAHTVARLLQRVIRDLAVPAANPAVSAVH